MLSGCLPEKNFGVFFLRARRRRSSRAERVPARKKSRVPFSTARPKKRFPTFFLVGAGGDLFFYLFVWFPRRNRPLVLIFFSVPSADLFLLKILFGLSKKDPFCLVPWMKMMGDGNSEINEMDVLMEMEHGGIMQI